MELHEGATVAGRYRLVGLLGRGGMGAVWRAEHIALAAPVAMKVIDAEMAQSEEARARFLREARAVAALKSPHVVQVSDFGVDGDMPFIVMELLEGETLASRLERVHRLDSQATTRIVGDIARAVGKAHELGIVHRDLKPDNVFLVRQDDHEIAKVLDFGIAKIAGGPLEGISGATRTGALLGTPFYMSPEQARGNRSVDFRSDLWSLGIIAFECLCGQRPITSDALGDLLVAICVSPLPVPSAIAHVPPGFDAWFARATDRDPAARFGSAREMARALGAALGVAADGARRSQLSLPDADAESATIAAVAPPAFSVPDTSTASPVSSTLSGTHPAPRPSRLRRVLAAASVCAIGVAVSVLVLAQRERPEPETATSSSAAVAPAAPASFDQPRAVLPAVAPEVGPARAASVAPTAPRSRVPAAQATKPAASKDAPAPSKAPPAPPAPPATKPGCNPNYTLDADGNKRFKPECF